MKKSFPGYLFGKSLRLEERPFGTYRDFFVHEALSPYIEKIRAIRDAFSWDNQDGETRSGPVVIAEPIAEKQVLVLRFCDVGKDEYDRPQTLRVEGFLCGVEDFSFFWDGRFRAVPIEGEKSFSVSYDGPLKEVTIGKRYEYSAEGEYQSKTSRFSERTEGGEEPGLCACHFPPEKSSRPSGCESVWAGRAERKSPSRFSFVALGIIAALLLFLFLGGKYCLQLNGKVDALEKSVGELKKRQETLENNLASRKKSVLFMEEQVAANAGKIEKLQVLVHALRESKAYLTNKTAKLESSDRETNSSVREEVAVIDNVEKENEVGFVSTEKNRKTEKNGKD